MASLFVAGKRATLCLLLARSDDVEAWGRGSRLLLDLSPYDLQVLDRYEEVESGVYRRELVEVEAWGCGAQPMHIRADAYIAGPALEASTAK